MRKSGFTPLLALGTAVSLFIGGSAMAQDLTEAQVEAIVERVIKERPELIMESLTNMEQSRILADKTAGLQEITMMMTDPTAPRIGDASAMPAGVVFLDHNCPHCRVTHAEILKWAEAEPGRALTVVEFPVLGPGSEVAARAALVAQDIGRYAEVTEALMSREGPNTPQNIMDTLRTADLSDDEISKIVETMMSDAVTAKIVSGQDLGRKLGITGTPGAVFGQEVVVGAFSAADLERIAP